VLPVIGLESHFDSGCKIAARFSLQECNHSLTRVVDRFCSMQLSINFWLGYFLLSSPNPIKDSHDCSYCQSGELKLLIWYSKMGSTEQV
jgi:hypothetical protein